MTDNTGHNGETGGSVAADHLRQIVERIERSEEEKRECMANTKEIYTEAKSQGFCVKTLRKVIRLRALDPNERAEEQAMMDLYLSAMGMLPNG